MRGEHYFGDTMQSPIHNLASLFKQLGLDTSNQAIEDFINRNRPLPDSVKLYEAGFWNASQALFLESALDEDADWADVVDELNVLLREPHE
jgi:hypothetical protein